MKREKTDERGFETKREAEPFLATVEVSNTGGTYVDDSHSKVTVADVGEPWPGSESGSSLKPPASLDSRPTL